MSSAESALALPQGMVVSATNLILEPESAFAVKRYGSAAYATSPPGTAGNTRLGARFKPQASTEANAELWIFCSTPSAHQQIGSGAFSTITLPAAVTLVYRAAQFNNKLFLACGTGASNRLAVWDGTSIRWVGFAAPGVVSVANTGAGAYAATIRYYRMRYVEVSGSIVVRASELSTAVSFTPSGAGTAARVTKPAALSEGETHWDLFGSPDDVTYQLLSQIAVGTTTYDDSTAPASYDGDLPPEDGTNVPPPACKRIIVAGGNGAQLLMAVPGTTGTGAAGETAPKRNRVWLTRVLGETDEGDDEAITQTVDRHMWIDVGENTADGVITEMAGPVDGQNFVFTKRRIFRLVSTGDVRYPLVCYPITDQAGALENDYGPTAVVGEDGTGASCCWFISDRGLYQYGRGGLKYASFDIQTEWLAATRTTPFVFWHPRRRQVWMVAQSPSGNNPARIFKLQVNLQYEDEQQRLRGGWVIDTNADDVVFYSMLLHNTTPGTATVAAETLIPYSVGKVTTAGTSRIRIWEQSTAADAGTAFTSAVESKVFLPGNGETRARMTQPVVLGQTASGVTLTVGYKRDFGTESRTGTVSMTAEASETGICRGVEGLEQADVSTVAMTLTDGGTPTTRWQVDAILMRFEGGKEAI